MLTYQDLLQVDKNDEKKKLAFVRQVIADHKSSKDYKIALMGYEYDHKRNTTILKYEKTLRTFSGKEVPDTWSPNHKTTRNFFNYFTTQQNQYLLANGVQWQNDSTGEKLGDDFDTKLQKAGKIALTQKVAFGFFNLDHVDVFEFREFAPLYDEENGSLRAGVRFWQIDSTKPVRATLYEEDGYTSYIWGERDTQGKIDEFGRVYEAKRPYIQKIKTSPADGTVIYDGENYPSFPIIPLWGNPLHQSELVGIQEQIDAYDLLKNANLNDADTALLYWIIKGAGGMDDPDLATFMMRVKQNHFAALEEGQDIQPVSVNVPYESREEILNRLERDLYKDYGALNVENIAAGAVTATQIMAAYEPLNNKADQYEYCILEFIRGILTVAGIDPKTEKPTFTRSKLVNVAEEVTTVLQAGEVLDDEYTTRKILNLLGDGDKADEMLERKAADELAMGEMTPTRNASMYEITSILGKLKRGDLTEKTALTMLQRVGLSEEEAQETLDGQLGDDELAEEDEDLLTDEDLGIDEENEDIEDADVDEEEDDSADIDELSSIIDELLKKLGKKA